jgi:multiple sugar transport system substrate-binding protein
MWTAAAIGLVAAVTLAGCGSTKGSSSGPVEITVWTQGTNNKTLEAATKAFEKQNPNIKVDLVKQPFNSYPTLERAAITAKKGPDVVENYPTAVFSYYQGLLPLKGYVTSQQKSALTGWALASTGLSASGTPYGVPWSGQGILWYYNKALFVKAGLNPNNPPKTWAQFLADCATLKSHGITPITAGFKDGYYAEWFMDVFGGQFMTKKQLANFPAHPNWTEPGIARGLGYMLRLYKDGYMSSNALGINLFPDAVNAFGAGQGAMFLGLAANNTNWSQFYPSLGSKLGTFLTPVLPGSLYPHPRLDWAPSYAWSITKWSKHPKQAYAWISFVTNAKSQADGFALDGLISNNSASSVHAKVPVASRILVWAKDKSLQFLGPDDTMQPGPEATFDQLVPQVVSGHATVKSLLQKVQQAQSQAPPVPGT